MTSEFAPEQSAKRFLWRLAHIAPIGYLVIVITFVPIDLTLHQPLRLWIGAPVIAFAVPLVLAHKMHENALCGICAALTPLDGNAAAQRHNMQLRLFHKGKIIAIAILGVLAGIAAAGWILHWPDIIGQLALDISFLETAASMHVDITHRLLEPWCPYCHWDDSGDHEPSPEPTSPVGQATT